MSPFITAGQSDQSVPGPYSANKFTSPPHDTTSRLDTTPALTKVSDKTSMHAKPVPDLSAHEPVMKATSEDRSSRALQQSQTPTAPAPKVARILREEPERLPQLHQPRPSTPRAQTDPTPDLLLHATHHPRPRNRSPYSRSHLRSQSSSSLLSAPLMTRAHSLPSVINTVGSLSFSPARPSSPLRSPARSRSPFKASDEPYSHSGAPSVCDISEDAELELTPRGSADKMPPLISFHSTTLPRNRRRPASPLYQVSNVPFGSAPTSTPTSTNSSPLLAPTKFNEPFPSTYQYSSSYSSSVPSTPTSMRSRSPSVSSLETIPDSPDAEEEAIEADRIAKLKAAADAESAAADPLRRGSLDVPGETRTLRFGKRDARKRWSVCGAERRGDLDLETIWESAD